MEIIAWILIGAAAGWATFAFLDMNEERGIVLAAIIGATGGLFGGKLIAPFFTTAAVAGGFNPDALLFAALGAMVLLAVANHLVKRWGV